MVTWLTDDAGELLDTAGIARLLGLSVDYVRDRLTRRPDFPAPAADPGPRSRRWHRADVLRFAAGPPDRARRDDRALADTPT